MFYTKKKQNFIAPYIVMFFLILSALLLIVGLGQFASETSLDPDGEKAMIQKYAVQCYASEGGYPPDLGYLTQHYGLILDPQKYTYYYSAFGSNIMPEIIVTNAVNPKDDVLERGDNHD